MRNKQYIVKFGMLLCAMIICINLCACSKKTKTIVTTDETKEYCYGVISSYEGDSTSKLLCFDSELNMLSDQELKISNIGGYRYYLPIVLDKHMYEISLGQGINKDDCAIVSLDLETGELVKYPFPDRVNITDFTVTENYIYAISNSNYKTYVDRYNFSDGSITSYVMDSVGIDLCLCGEDLYVFMDDMKSYKMYLVDVDAQTDKVVADLSEYYDENDVGVNYTIVFQNSIYMPFGNTIVKFSKNDGKLEEIPVSYNNAFGAFQKDGLLYVSCTDITDTETDMIVLDMDNDEIVQQYHFKNGMEQFWVDGEDIILLSDDYVLCKYKMGENGSCLLQNQNDLAAKNYDFLSALFVKE